MNKLKETNGKYYQECEIVMLDTNDKTAPILSYLNDKSLQYFPNTYWSNGDLSKRHLYFLSNEEIKDGDWYLNIVSNEIVNVDFNIDYEQNHCKKIIATTDISLRLPQPSKEFIQAYTKAYNEGNPIKWVNVEVEEYATETDYKLGIDCSTPLFRLKLNSSNEITIKKIKDSWTREEVIRLCRGAHLHGEQGALNLHNQVFKQWVEQNL